MRSFSQEKKDGTLELLFTRPISTLNIVLSKYLASLFLVIISLALTIVFYISIILLGDPVGNIDHGATWGSYIGLLFLAASYVGIGIFASSLSDNIIVSFLAGIFFCAWMYIAFSFVGNLFPLGGTGNIILNLGMDVHFQSLSRGVIDSRDLIYFISVIIIFIMLTNLKLKSRN
jgi:ABC-2 type transport system permease protein